MKTSCFLEKYCKSNIEIELLFCFVIWSAEKFEFLENPTLRLSSYMKTLHLHQTITIWWGTKSSLRI